MRSDILRLKLMARVGGVYFDTDIKPVRPLDACSPPGDLSAVSSPESM